MRAASAEPAPATQTHQLELEVPDGEQTIRKVPPGECKVLRQLVAKHGGDHTAMARDMRLNPHPHTAAHLRKRIGKMVEEDAAEEAAVAAAQQAGKRVPRLRGTAKKTKLPNRAFKKTSTNFC
mgnify:CR=1 FL=1